MIHAQLTTTIGHTRFRQLLSHTHFSKKKKTKKQKTKQNKTKTKTKFIFELKFRLNSEKKSGERDEPNVPI